MLFLAYSYISYAACVCIIMSFFRYIMTYQAHGEEASGAWNLNRLFYSTQHIMN